MTDTTIDYEHGIIDERASKDDFLRTSHHSPIPHSDRLSFGGLAYYPVDPALRFAGLRLRSLTDDVELTFQIPTSDGAFRPARRLGTLDFEVDGVQLALFAYRLGTSPDALFLPFLDGTSGPETYGAGRYLDIEPEPDGTYVLDFNAAYHPFCAYAPEYSCPLTPAENRLPVRIEAGERLPIPATR